MEARVSMSGSTAFGGDVSSKERLIDLCWGSSEPSVALWPYQFFYRDALNTAFELDVLCLSRSSVFESKELLGRSLGVGVMSDCGPRRWLSGMVTQVQMLGEGGGFAMVGLRLESALSLLGRRITCRMFQDQSVPQIVSTILEEHRKSNPRIATVFDHATQLERDYAPRSYCVQFNESDQQFIDRLLAEEGITYRFLSSADDGVPRHRLILSDIPLPTGEIERLLRYRPEAGMVGVEEHMLTHWSARRKLVGSSVEISSYDYKPATRLQGWDGGAQQQGEAGLEAASSLGTYHAQTLYYGESNRDLDHYARLRLKAEELNAKTFFGRGRLRTLMTGEGFVLEEHPGHVDDSVEERNFVVIALQLRVKNNLPEAWRASEAMLASMRLARAGMWSAEDPTNAPDTATESYSCSFSAVRRDVPLVPAYAGELAKPTASGPQTALVVGPEGEEVFTDEHGRIHIQPFWQRGQEHPNGTAQFNERSSTAVRVAMPSAGEGFGHQFLPRIGQEVLVDFLFGDIDRPVVVGVLYNGRHPPPLFSGGGALPGNRTLSGIRSREHHGSGYSELLMDDTPGQVRARLAATPHATELNLGRLTTPRQDGHAQLRGDGAELRSDAAIAVRAATGLLLTTYARKMAQGAQLDRQELLGLLDECCELFRGLGQTAAARGAQQSDSAGMGELQDALTGWPKVEGEGGEPVVAIAAEAGVLSATPRSQLHYAGCNHDIVARDHVQSASGGATRLQAGAGLSLYSQDGGIQAIANRGKVMLQAQDDDVALNAQKFLHASATEGEVLVTAPCIRLVADDGSYIRIGNGIEIGTQAEVKVHGSSHDWLGPKTDKATLPAFGRDPAARQIHFHYEGDAGASASGVSYRLEMDDGSKVDGVTARSGTSERVARDSMQRLLAAVKPTLLDATSSTQPGVTRGEEPHADEFDMKFLLKDEVSGEPLAGVRYRIQLESGDAVVGVTNAEGLTRTVHSSSPQIAKIEAPYDDDCTTDTHTHDGPGACGC